jgi:hypothetical protein
MDKPQMSREDVISTLELNIVHGNCPDYITISNAMAYLQQPQPEMNEEALNALSLILPLAKGYAYKNKIEANMRYIRIAEKVLEDAKPSIAPACVCGQPETLGIVHRTDGPCYIPEPSDEGERKIVYHKLPPEEKTCGNCEHYKISCSALSNKVCDLWRKKSKVGLPEPLDLNGLVIDNAISRIWTYLTELDYYLHAQEK